MSDEIIPELGHHVLTGIGATGLMAGLFKWLGGRQVKQLDDTLAEFKKSLEELNKLIQKQTTQIAVMGEQMSTLLAERQETIKLAERMSKVEASLSAMHERIDSLTSANRKRR